ETDPDLDQEPERTWRATGSGRRAPAIAVGRIVHAAIQRSALPGSAGYERFIENEAFRAGLVDMRQRQAAIEESSELLGRLAAHKLWGEVRAAEGAQHEIPFTTSDPQGQVQSGQIDLLWRAPEGWKLVDFKSDRLRDEAELQAAVEEHAHQVERYMRCAASLLGEKPVGLLCFLDAVGEVRLVEV
ncbi:MAG: PD-(D/E)XK nuclease family protein, partial [Chloroflexota bacterium]